MKRLENKTAVITGGGTNGIGRATAARLVTEGAHVFITGRRQAELDDAVAAIGPGVTAVAGDISDASDVDRLYTIVAEHGRGLDILFANAAIGSFGPIDEITEAEIHRVFDVNVIGTALTVQKAVPQFNEGASVIINTSAAIHRGAAGLGVYAASKAALRSFSRTWANELKDRGVRVNTISPGPIDTSGIAELVGYDKIDAYNAELASTLPIGRTGRPHEVAAAVAFLASDDSRFMLGADIAIDGGANQI